MPDTSNMELLRDYGQHGAEAAFAELTQRHIALVYSAAYRQVGCAAQAEEITQAVFIILARKAASLRPGTVLEGWLYETTRLTALRFLRGERRRQFREQEAYMQSTLQESSDASAWAQLGPLLDEAMSRLGQKDRDAVILRYFKEKTVREVATALRVSEASAQRRVLRALEKLRKFLVKRGVSSSTAIITGAISANSVQAVPVALAKSVTAVAVVKGSIAAASTLTLVKGAMDLMAWLKAKTAVAVSVVMLAAAGTVAIAIPHWEEAVMQFKGTPGGARTMEAVSFLGSLQRKDQLPGFPKDEKRSGIVIPGLYYATNGVWHLNNTNTESYPVLRTLEVITNAREGSVWHYTVVRTSETNTWQLQKAWQTDHKGKVIEEYPVR